MLPSLVSKPIVYLMLLEVYSIEALKCLVNHWKEKKKPED